MVSCGHREPMRKPIKEGMVDMETTGRAVRSRMVVGAALGVVAVMFLGAAAWACTNLATLNLSAPAGKPGDALTITGSSFRVPRNAGEALNPVLLRWNGVDGPVMAEAVPDPAGNISASVQIPDGQPGYYVIVAQQRNAFGADEYGTPARAAFQILGPNGQSVVQPTGSQTPSSVTSDPSSTGMIALTAGLGVLGLALFGSGFAVFAREARRRAVPATVATDRD